MKVCSIRMADISIDTFMPFPLPISKPELNGVALQQMQVLEVTGDYLWVVLWTFLWPIQSVNLGFGFLGRVDRFLVSLMFVANQVALTYRSGCQV